MTTLRRLATPIVTVGLLVAFVLLLVSIAPAPDWRHNIAPESNPNQDSSALGIFTPPAKNLLDSEFSALKEWAEHNNINLLSATTTNNGSFLNGDDILTLGAPLLELSMLGKAQSGLVKEDYVAMLLIRHELILGDATGLQPFAYRLTVVNEKLEILTQGEFYTQDMYKSLLNQQAESAYFGVNETAVLVQELEQRIRASSLAAEVQSSIGRWNSAPGKQIAPADWVSIVVNTSSVEESTRVLVDLLPIVMNTRARIRSEPGYVSAMQVEVITPQDGEVFFLIRDLEIGATMYRAQDGLDLGPFTSSPSLSLDEEQGPGAPPTAYPAP